MTSTTGRLLRRVSLPLLLTTLAAAPIAAQTPAQDPNAVDTGNFSASPTLPDAQQTLAHQIAQLPWAEGPISIAIGAATIAVPAGYEILTPPNGEKFLELNGNPPSPADAADNILQSDDLARGWFAILTYENTGHITDTQKIDANALLATMQKLNDQDNAARQKQGQPTQALTGWAIPPAYDKTIHRLAWAFDFSDPNNGQNIILNIRLLGRTGDLKAIIVDDPASLVKDLPDIDKALAGAGFPAGQTYEDAAASDPQSPYGLAAIIGGATPTKPQAPPAPPATPAPNPGPNKGLIAGIAVIAILLGFFIKRKRR